MPRRFELVGCIASAGFGPLEQRHRITIGHWDGGPLGPMIDVMWATPDGTRRLLADTKATADLVAAVYEFDEVEVVPITATRSRRVLGVSAGELRVEMAAGTPWALPPMWLRPLWVTRVVEAPIARAAFGVSAYGTSTSGVREWYRATQVRRVERASATLNGADLGRLGPVTPALGVGFSEPLTFPSMVLVRPVLEDRSARLDRIIDRARTGVPART